MNTIKKSTSYQNSYLIKDFIIKVKRNDRINWLNDIGLNNSNILSEIDQINKKIEKLIIISTRCFDL